MLLIWDPFLQKGRHDFKTDLQKTEMGEILDRGSDILEKCSGTQVPEIAQIDLCTKRML